MLVMKFGGASVRDAEGIARVTAIVRAYLGPQPLVVVVSAMDKTTNALERLAQLATAGVAADTEAQLRQIEAFHHRAVEQHFGAEALAVKQALAPYFDELGRVVQGVLLLGEFPPRIYDRIMAHGELISSVVLHRALVHAGLSADWADARQIITTDASFQQAEVVWSLTQANIDTHLRPRLRPQHVVVIQGYIASTVEGRTTTLGREGSDFTASILGHALGAERVVIWKDVPGVMSADPRQDPDVAQKIDRLSYATAVEMTFYGASVIHPKTIKPLQNLGIPLEVRSFLQPQAEGTRIGAEPAPGVPSRIRKARQVLITLTPRDFSFMDDRMMRQVFDVTHAAGLHVNLVQTSAISLRLVADDQPGIVAEVRSALTDAFEVEVRAGLSLRSLLFQAGRADALAGLDPTRIVLLQQDERHLHVLLSEE